MSSNGLNKPKAKISRPPDKLELLKKEARDMLKKLDYMSDEDATKVLHKIICLLSIDE